MPNPLTLSKWLTTAEACAYTGFCRQTLIAKANQGLITGHKPTGSQWRFDRESLDRFFTPDVTKKAVDIVRSLRR
jgi:excisionase family DNA binding protein